MESGGLTWIKSAPSGSSPCRSNECFGECSRCYRITYKLINISVDYEITGEYESALTWSQYHENISELKTTLLGNNALWLLKSYQVACKSQSIFSILEWSSYSKIFVRLEVICNRPPNRQIVQNRRHLWNKMSNSSIFFPDVLQCAWWRTVCCQHKGKN